MLGLQPKRDLELVKSKMRDFIDAMTYVPVKQQLETLEAELGQMRFFSATCETIRKLIDMIIPFLPERVERFAPSPWYVDQLDQIRKQLSEILAKFDPRSVKRSVDNFESVSETINKLKYCRKELKRILRYLSEDERQLPSIRDSSSTDLRYLYYEALQECPKDETILDNIVDAMNMEGVPALPQDYLPINFGFLPQNKRLQTHNLQALMLKNEHGAVSATRVNVVKGQEECLFWAIELLSSHRHPGIPELKGVISVPPVIVVTEKIPKTLSQVIYNDKDATAYDFAVIRYQVAETMQWLHSKGFVHRNLTSQNILLRVAEDRYEPVITGLWRICHENCQSSDLKCPHQAPEIRNGEVYTQAADVWLYGVLLLEIVLQEDIPDEFVANEFCDRIPASEPTKDLIVKCLQEEPANRPTFDQILSELCNLRPDGESEGVSKFSLKIKAFHEMCKREQMAKSRNPDLNIPLLRRAFHCLLDVLNHENMFPIQRCAVRELLTEYYEQTLSILSENSDFSDNSFKTLISALENAASIVAGHKDWKQYLLDKNCQYMDAQLEFCKCISKITGALPKDTNIQINSYVPSLRDMIFEVTLHLNELRPCQDSDGDFSDIEAELTDLHNLLPQSRPVSENPIARLVELSGLEKKNLTEGDFEPGSEDIGSGGFGHVCKRKLRETGKEVAVKVITLDDENINFHDITGECHAMAAFRHENIIRLLGIMDEPASGNEKRKVSLVTEFCSGLDLRKGKFCTSELMQALFKVIKALAFMHANGFVHRDVKEHNIVLNTEGEPIVIDFGLARDAEGVKETDSGRGTALYMAPELFNSGIITGKVDIFALAITIWELLPNRNESWVFKTPWQAHMAICKDQRPDIDKIVGTPGCLVAMLKNMWDSKPEHRMSARELLTYMMDNTVCMTSEDEKVMKRFYEKQRKEIEATSIYDVGGYNLIEFKSSAPQSSLRPLTP